MYLILINIAFISILYNHPNTLYILCILLQQIRNASVNFISPALTNWSVAFYILLSCIPVPVFGFLKRNMDGWGSQQAIKLNWYVVINSVLWLDEVLQTRLLLECTQQWSHLFCYLFSSSYVIICLEIIV